MSSLEELLNALEKELQSLKVLPRCRVVKIRRVPRWMFELVRGFPAEVKRVQGRAFSNGYGLNDITPVVRFFDIRSLSLISCGFGAQKITALTAILDNMPRLCKLNVKRNHIEHCVISLLEVLPRLPELQHINLEVNHFYSDSNPNAAMLVADFLETHPPILTLKLGINQL
jgi:hypothetical protein